MGNERKSRHARAGVLTIKERSNRRSSNLQPRRIQVSGQCVPAFYEGSATGYRMMAQAAKTKMTFNVDVIFDDEESLWIATCDLLGIVTEAKTFELLTQQVQDLVPDMIAANQIILGGRKPYLKFSHLEEAVI